MKILCKIFFIGTVLYNSHIHAQEIIVAGTITDTINTPLQNANVLAIPPSQKQQIKFSITDTQGLLSKSQKNISKTIIIKCYVY